MPSAAAHPRSRGENFEGGLAVLGGERLIPAHAGKTTREVTEPARRRAHPRSRGENTLTSTGTSVKAGSSPLTRGKPWNGLDDNGNPGLIPAHAGKTFYNADALRVYRAHPRSRGENVLPLICSIACRGSSPLTRGKPLRYRDRDYPRGLIPAHAGKTTPSVWPPLPAWAHPRSRGENGLQHAEVTLQEGSSPLTRGKRQGTTYNLPNYGLIPAHAGKTRSRGCLGRSAWAHPRSRGENSSDATPAKDSVGSSPLTRGKPHGRGGPAGEPGLIPAHAGKTSESTPCPG